MKRIAMAAIAISLLSTAQAEDGIEITPGKWRITATSNMPMMPQPQSKTTEECIEESKISPTTLFKENNECRLANVEVDGNDMAWQMTCDNPEGEGNLSADGNLSVDRDSLQGRIEMAIKVADQSMSYDITWEGERIGDCD
jgi:hypothetical protein